MLHRTASVVMVATLSACAWAEVPEYVYARTQGPTTAHGALDEPA